MGGLIAAEDATYRSGGLLVEEGDPNCWLREVVGRVEGPDLLVPP